MRSKAHFEPLILGWTQGIGSSLLFRFLGRRITFPLVFRVEEVMRLPIFRYFSAKYGPHILTHRIIMNAYPYKNTLACSLYKRVLENSCAAVSLQKGEKRDQCVVLWVDGLMMDVDGLRFVKIYHVKFYDIPFLVRG